jgi:hypothetical protein
MGKTSVKDFLTLLFRFPRIIGLCVALSVIIYAPSLDSGFQADDYHFLAMQKGTPPFPAVEWNLNRVVIFGLSHPGMASEYIEQGVIPWWSSQDLWVRYFRPLAGFLVSLDYHLFGDSPLPYHVHSLIWGVLLFLSCGLLLRRVLPGRIGAVALVIYTLSTIPSVPILWIVNRYSLVACVPAVLGLLAHVRWREDGWKPGLPLSVLGIAASLAGGEIAFSVLAFFFAYELTAAPGGYRQRSRALGPIVLLITGYAIVYTTFGFGASGSGMYFDQSRPAAEYVKTALSHLGVLLWRTYGGIPADVTLAKEILIPVSIMGYGFLVLALLLVRPFFSNETPELKRKLAWFGLGSFVSLGPVLLALPMDRLLVGSFLGGSVILSFLLVSTWDALRNRTEHGRMKRFGCLVVVVHLVFWNFVASPMIIGFQIMGRAEGSRKALKAVLNAELPDEGMAGQEVIVLYAPGRAGQIVTWYFQAMLDYLDKPVPPSFRVLTIAPCDQSLQRIDAHSLEVSCLNGKMLATMPEQLFRSPSLPLRTGDVIEAGVMTAEILETTGIYPTKVRFRFKKALESQNFLFLEWKDGTLRKTSVPEIGETRMMKFEEPGFWKEKMEPFLMRLSPQGEG